MPLRKLLCKARYWDAIVVPSIVPVCDIRDSEGLSDGRIVGAGGEAAVP